MPQLILIRHGQSQWNLENRFTGWWDVDVTEKGAAEAWAAGELMTTLRQARQHAIGKRQWTLVVFPNRDGGAYAAAIRRNGRPRASQQPTRISATSPAASRRARRVQSPGGAKSSARGQGSNSMSWAKGSSGCIIPSPSRPEKAP